MYHNVSTDPEWVENEIADYISHIQDYDDWQLNHKVFDWLDQLWGPRTVVALLVFIIASSLDLTVDFFKSRN